MYQFSLEYFSRIFVNEMKACPKAATPEERVSNLISQITRTVYHNISQALFNQHKKIFSFMIAIRVQQINKAEYNYFNKGNFSIPKL